MENPHKYLWNNMTPREVLRYAHDNDHLVEIQTDTAVYEDCEVTSFADDAVQFATAASRTNYRTVVVYADLAQIRKATFAS